MPDNLETKAVKRFARWITVLTALVVAPEPPEGLSLNVTFPDPWSATIVQRLFADFHAVKKADLGFGLLNDKSLEGLFLYILLDAEWAVTPWGRTFRSFVVDNPIGSGGIRLSRMPFFLLPQECIVTGESLGFDKNNFNSPQGHPKGKIHVLNAKDDWKTWNAKMGAAFDAIEGLKEVEGDRDAIFQRHQDNFSILWEAYKMITEKVDRPYTPRYMLFETYKDIPFPEVFLNLFVERLGRDVPIDIEDWPSCFSKSLAGKRVTDFEDTNGQPVGSDGVPLDPKHFITLKQLDEYFIAH